MGIYRNFDIFHPLLNLSLVFLSEHETINKILIKASKFTTPRALSINKLVDCLNLMKLGLSDLILHNLYLGGQPGPVGQGPTELSCLPQNSNLKH